MCIMECFTIVQIERITNNNDFFKLLTEERFDFRFDCGYPKPAHMISVDDKKNFISTVTKYLVVYRHLPALYQIRNGFRNCLEFEKIIDAHPNQVWSLLIAEGKPNLKAESLQQLFTIKYSEAGSNLKISEVNVVMNFWSYMQDCEGTILNLK